MTPLRAVPLFALLAAAAVEPRGCARDPSAPTARSEPAAVTVEHGASGAGCVVVPFQMDALYRAGADDGMRSARVCCAATAITVEASDPMLREMVSGHGPLRRYLARLCLDPAHRRADHVTTAESGELCAGARCARMEVR